MQGSSDRANLNLSGIKSDIIIITKILSLTQIGTCRNIFYAYAVPKKLQLNHKSLITIT